MFGYSKSIKNEKKLKRVIEQIANAKENLESRTAAWKSEKEIVDTVQNIKKQIDSIYIDEF